jgi:DNA-binding transcriptional ArsR family regulator
MFKDLDPILHSQLRLAIVSLLLSLEEADFTYLKEKTGASSGNLSVQLDKLKQAGYIDIQKSFRNNYPLTTCRITTVGIAAFETYVKALQEYIKLR